MLRDCALLEVRWWDFVGRNRAALRRMTGAETRDKLNPCPIIAAPGISAAPGSLP